MKVILFLSSYDHLPVSLRRHWPLTLWHDDFMRPWSLYPDSCSQFKLIFVRPKNFRLYCTIVTWLESFGVGFGLRILFKRSRILNLALTSLSWTFLLLSPSICYLGFDPTLSVPVLPSQFWFANYQQKVFLNFLNVILCVMVVVTGCNSNMVK